jgi:hypothetical protein
MRILLFTGELGQFNYYRHFGERLLARDVEIGFCCDRDDPGVATTIEAVCNRAGFHFLKHAGDREAGALGLMGRAALYRFLWRYKRKCRQTDVAPSHDELRQLKSFLHYHIYRLDAARCVLQGFRPDVIAMGEDGIANNYWAVAAAHAQGIKVAVLPYGAPDSADLIEKGIEEQAAANDLKRPAGSLGTYIRTECPQWIASTRHGEVLYFPQAFVVALDLMGIAPKRPWLFHGGQADRLLLEGPETAARLSTEGIDPAKFEFTGSIYTDVLHDSLGADAGLRAAFDEMRPISPGKLRVLVALPSSDQVLWGHGSPFGSIAKYAGALKSFAEVHRNIELGWTLHPRMMEEDREQLRAIGVVDDGGFAVSKMPSYDVFLQSRSSLARWAFVARKPVIDFDMYGFGKDEYPGSAGYFYHREFEGVTLTLLDLMDPDSYGAAARGSALTGSGFGEVDGKSIDRLIGAFEKLSRRS